MSEYTINYISRRIVEIGKLQIPAENKLHKLDTFSSALDAFKKGLITEQELLFLFA